MPSQWFADAIERACIWSRWAKLRRSSISTRSNTRPGPWSATSCSTTTKPSPGLELRRARGLFQLQPQPPPHHPPRASSNTREVPLKNQTSAKLPSSRSTLSVGPYSSELQGDTIASLTLHRSATIL